MTNMMTRNGFLHVVSANAQRLVDDQTCPDDVRAMAGEIMDLSTLMATWPIPPSLNLDEDLKHGLFQLYRQSGIALCNTQRCLEKVEATDSPVCDRCLTDQ